MSFRLLWNLIYRRSRQKNTILNTKEGEIDTSHYGEMKELFLLSLDTSHSTEQSIPKVNFNEQTSFQLL